MSDPSGKHQRPPGTESCGCCDGVAASTPTGLFNRAGLSAISYRIGEYAQFKESLQAGLSSSDFPELAGLRTRETDDYTLALIDAVSCAADVLTFYQERLANESFLRTATERVSLQEMAKLIGYRLRPGVAAETWLAFALEPPRSPPPGLTPDPGTFVTGIPTLLTLESGLQVQSVPGPDEQPQTFETVEGITARPEWNAIRPWLAAPHAPGLGATETWVKGVANNLKVGDALVFVDPRFLSSPTTNKNWDFRLIDTVEIESAADRTHVTWKKALDGVSALVDPTITPQLHVFRKRAAVFGHNAPMWSSMSRQFRHGYPGGKNATDWPDFTIGDPVDPLDNQVDLDTVFSELNAGGLAVLTRFGFESSSTGKKPAAGTADAFVDVAFKPNLFTELYRIDRVADVSRAGFALSGKVTRIDVTGRSFRESFFDAPDAVRETSVYVQSELLELVPYPVREPIDGDALPLAVSPDGLQAGYKLIVTGLRKGDGVRLVHQATLVDVQPNANGAVLTIKPPLSATLQRDSVVVFGNVATATHGEKVAQILGAGDASKRFQRFELKRTPLTYRRARNEIGAASALSVRVDDIEWTEQPTLFGCGPNDRAYTLTTDEQGKTWVVFGDGVRGARLRSGVNNVRTRYRQGLGKDGNVAGDQLTQLVTRPLGLKGVSNPVAAQGGTDPEPTDQARRTMPLGTRTLGRVVSLLDYEDFALAYTGIAKAQAQVLPLRGGPTIAITVAGQDGATLSASDSAWHDLSAALKDHGDPHVRIALLSYRPGTFNIGLKVKRDPAYAIKPLLQAVEAALRAHYAFDVRGLGQPVLQSEVIAVAHSVPGVVAVDLDYLYGGTEPTVQTLKSRQTRLLASRMRVSGGMAIPAELLTLDPAAPFDRLEEMT